MGVAFDMNFPVPDALLVSTYISTRRDSNTVDLNPWPFQRNRRLSRKSNRIGF